MMKCNPHQTKSYIIYRREVCGKCTHRNRYLICILIATSRLSVRPRRCTLTRFADTMIAHEDALECVNDTYIAAWNKIPPERPMRFLSWLYRVCRNIVCDRIDWNNASKRNSNMNCMLDELEECLADSNAKYEGELSDIGRCLSDFLNGLETEKRVLFVRRYWYGMTIDELADMSGRSKSSVKTTLFRIRAELKKYLDEEGVYL